MPRFLRGYHWGPTPAPSTPSADATLSARPLPKPPPAAYTEHALRDLLRRPDVFRIVTPINVARLAALTSSHPNRPFVDSILHGFVHGFWPSHDGREGDASTFQGNQRSVDEDPAHMRAQRDVEVAAGRFSPPQSYCPPDVVPYPLGLVPKPHDVVARRLISDQSFGEDALNAGIDRDDVRVRYDTLHDLGPHVTALQARHPGKALVVWKSDMQGAFRMIPMHRLWQRKQLVRIDGRFYHDRCATFGSRASPYIYCRFAALVVWVAIHVQGLGPVLHYMDDHFGVALASDLVAFRGQRRPRSQVGLLQLWDELGIPWQEAKQLWGERLEVIGFEVDANEKTITLADSGRAALITELYATADDRFHKLQHYQRLLGWVNWALNVYPLARPGLSSTYAKIAGKKQALALVPRNTEMQRDLRWVAARVQSSPGVQLLGSVTWDPDDADLVVLCDASLFGLGFYCPSKALGFYCRLRAGQANILFNESACVLAAFLWACSTSARRILLITDSLDTVAFYNALKGAPPYSHVLMAYADALLGRPDLSVQVRHVDGDQNTVADALSRLKLPLLADVYPQLQLHAFSVPAVYDWPTAV